MQMRIVSSLENIICSSIYYFMELLNAKNRTIRMNDVKLRKNVCIQKGDICLAEAENTHQLT